MALAGSLRSSLPVNAICDRFEEKPHDVSQSLQNRGIQDAKKFFWSEKPFSRLFLCSLSSNSEGTGYKANSQVQDPTWKQRCKACAAPQNQTFERLESLRRTHH